MQKSLTSTLFFWLFIVVVGIMYIPSLIWKQRAALDSHNFKFAHLNKGHLLFVLCCCCCCCFLFIYYLPFSNFVVRFMWLNSLSFRVANWFSTSICWLTSWTRSAICCCLANLQLLISVYYLFLSIPINVSYLFL